jgi:hypothetical protein
MERYQNIMLYTKAYFGCPIENRAKEGRLDCIKLVGIVTARCGAAHPNLPSLKFQGLKPSPMATGGPKGGWEHSPERNAQEEEETGSVTLSVPATKYLDVSSWGQEAEWR